MQHFLLFSLHFAFSKHKENWTSRDRIRILTRMFMRPKLAQEGVSPEMEFERVALRPLNVVERESQICGMMMMIYGAEDVRR